MGSYRTSRTGNRQARTTQIDHDILEGIPVRHWRKKPVSVATSQERDLSNAILTSKSGYGELLLPRDFSLLPEHSQALLRAARLGLFRSADATNDDKTNDAGGDQQGLGPDSDLLAQKWSLVPRDQERAEPEYLAKRRKGLPSTYGGIAKTNAGSATMRKTKVRKVDANGNDYIVEALVPEGQSVEGEILKDETVPVEVVAPGTVVDGLGVANHEGLVVATDSNLPSSAQRKRPPIPRKKRYASGRGMKRRKKKRLAAAAQGGDIHNNVVQSTARGGDSQAGSTDLVMGGMDGAALTNPDIPAVPDAMQDDEEEGSDDSSEGEDGDEAEDGNESDQDGGEASSPNSAHNSPSKTSATTKPCGEIETLHGSAQRLVDEDSKHVGLNGSSQPLEQVSDRSSVLLSRQGAAASEPEQPAGITISSGPQDQDQLRDSALTQVKASETTDITSNHLPLDRHQPEVGDTSKGASLIPGLSSTSNPQSLSVPQETSLPTEKQSPIDSTPKAPTLSPPTPIRTSLERRSHSPQAPTMSPPTPLDRDSSPESALMRSGPPIPPLPASVPATPAPVSAIPGLLFGNANDEIRVEAAPDVRVPKLDAEIPHAHNPLDGLAAPEVPPMSRRLAKLD